MSTANDIVGIASSTTINVDALGEAFDDASQEARVEAIRSFSKTIQANLFEAAEGRDVPIEHMVPEGTGPLTEVIHEGQNTLPMFSSFQKRFCKPSASEQPAEREMLWGYNHQAMRPFTGPGYFISYEDEETGEFWIDYRDVPPERPDAWPRIISNKARLGRVVYHGMVDRLRRVSQHCTIGRAFKDGPTDNWFVLVRQD
jgi:hypothetical protein